MTEKITYYALIDDSTTRERPRTVLRRVENDEGQTDELFSRNLKWEFSPLLYSAERGDLANDFVPIDEEEAERIVARIRSRAGALPGAAPDQEAVA
jgi:hypothetical protein